MDPDSSELSPAETAPSTEATNTVATITVRYWAAARAAAGVDQDVLVADGPTSVSDLVAQVIETHPGQRLAEVLGVCSVLVADRPVQQRFWGSVMVEPGSTLEFLPPFAGG